MPRAPSVELRVGRKLAKRPPGLELTVDPEGDTPYSLGHFQVGIVTVTEALSKVYIPYRRRIEALYTPNSPPVVSVNTV